MFPPPPISSPSQREGEDLKRRERGGIPYILPLKEREDLRRGFLLFPPLKGRIKRAKFLHFWLDFTLYNSTKSNPINQIQIRYEEVI